MGGTRFHRLWVLVLVLATLCITSQVQASESNIQKPMVGLKESRGENARLDEPSSDAVPEWCGNGVSAPGALSICDDLNPCTEEIHDQTLGCFYLPNNGPCDDGNPCSLHDSCHDKVCVGGKDWLDCNDGNSCTTDGCQDGVGCINDPMNDQECSDGSVCTEYDQCVSGRCQGLEIRCDDGNACTADVCDPLVRCVPEALKSSACRPIVLISWPNRGATLNHDRVVVVKGSAFSPAAPITSFTLNGERVVLDAHGSFAFPMSAAQGLNLIHAQATDMLGGLRKSVQSFQYSPIFFPHDVADPEPSIVKDGIMVFLGPGVWDDNNTSDVDDIATIMTMYLNKLDIGSMMTNPVVTATFLQCTYRLNVYNVDFGTPNIDLKPVAGGLSIGIRLPNFKADVELRTSRFYCPGASGVTGARTIKVVGRVLVSINPAGGVEVGLQSLHVALGGFYLSLDGVTGTLLNWLIGMFEGAIAYQLEAALHDHLASMIPALLEQVLQSLALNRSFDVAPLMGKQAPVRLEIRTGLSSVMFNTKGSVLGMKAAVLAPRNNRHSPLGSIGRATCLGKVPRPFKLPGAGQLEIAVHDDLLNQIPFGMYWGGLLNLDVGSDRIDDLSAYGITDMRVRLEAMLPPILTSCNPESELRIQLGDIQIDASLNLLGSPITLTAFASLELQADVIVVQGATGKELSVAIGNLRTFEIQIVSLSGTLVGAEEMLLSLVKDHLIASLSDRLAGEALGRFPIPAIDLSVMDPNLPEGSVIELALKQVMRFGGYTALSGDVKE